MMREGGRGKAVLQETLKGAQGSELEIQCAQHMVSMKKQQFSSHPRTKVRHHRPSGSASAQPWSGDGVMILVQMKSEV